MAICRMKSISIKSNEIKEFGYIENSSIHVYREVLYLGMLDPRSVYLSHYVWQLLIVTLGYICGCSVRNNVQKGHTLTELVLI